MEINRDKYFESFFLNNKSGEIKENICKMITKIPEILEYGITYESVEIPRTHLWVKVDKQYNKIETLNKLQRTLDFNNSEKYFEIVYSKKEIKHIENKKI